MSLTFRTRQLFAFSIVVGLMGLSTTWAGYTFLKRTVISEAQLRVEMDLNSAWVAYHEALSDLHYAIFSATQNSLGRSLTDASLGGDSLSVLLTIIRDQNDFDFLTLIGRDSLAMARSGKRGQSLSGRPDPIIEAALGGVAAKGTVLVSAEDLRVESDKLAERAFINLVSTEKAVPTKQEAETRGLLMEAAIPLFDEGGEVRAVLRGGRLLNRRFELVDSIRHAVFGEQSFEGKPVGTVTIFLWDVRVATNVMQADQTRALGTRVSEEVFQRVLVDGKRFVDRAFVVTDWYLSAYDPITDPLGNIIGIIYVGLLEKRYLAFGSSLLRQFLFISFASMVLAVVVALYLTRAFRKPLQQLVDATRELSAGNLAARVHLRRASRETSELATAFNAMAENLERRNEELNQAAERLRWAYTQADDKNRAYLETLGFVTHELKSPLASIVFAIGALRDKMLGPLVPQQEAALKSAAGSADYLEATIANYLNLSRVEEGELKLEAKNVDVGREILPGVIDRTHELASDRNLTVKNLVGPDCRAICDPSLITSVFQNLVTNAIIYGREGGNIEIQCEDSIESLAFSVWNEGAGFDPEIGDRLFERFFRVSQKGQNTKAGTGIGLFVTRRIVESHGGRVWAESSPGNWARFSFSLPKKSPHGPEEKTSTP